MKITFFIGGLIKGGAERVTCNLANFLVSRGHDVEILTMSESKSYPLDERVTRQVLLYNKNRKGFISDLIYRRKRLKNYLLQHDCDCYVVMLPITTIFLLGMSKYTHVPIVASERCYPSVFSQKIQRALLLFLSKRAKGWVFQTKQARQWYGNHIGNSKEIIIPNAINEAFLRPLYKGERRKVIAAVGRLCDQKNYPLLLNAFAGIVKDMPEYRLLILGEGEKRSDLESQAKELGIDQFVDMPGYDNDIPSRLHDVSLYVLSSDYEGMPNTLMEAMALGLPCIATDCDGGGAAFLIDNERNGVLVPKGDVDALSNAMKKMLNDRVFAERCGHEAHTICNRLAPENVYGQWEKFIKEVVKS